MQIEKIEKEGNPENIWGIKSSKNYENYLMAKIRHFVRTKQPEHEFMVRSFLKAYKHFERRFMMKATIPIKQYKGVSGLEIRRFPNYFQTIEHRKKENGDGEIEIVVEKHKILREDIEPLIKAISKFTMKKKYKTRYVAQEYLKMAEIWKDKKGRKFFDDKGFNFESFFGNRSIYTPFNISLKILAYFDYIHYYKSGCVERLKDSFEIQEEFL